MGRKSRHVLLFVSVLGLHLAALFALSLQPRPAKPQAQATTLVSIVSQPVKARDELEAQTMTERHSPPAAVSARTDPVGLLYPPIAGVTAKESSQVKGEYAAGRPEVRDSRTVMESGSDHSKQPDMDAHRSQLVGPPTSPNPPTAILVGSGLPKFDAVTSDRQETAGSATGTNSCAFSVHAADSRPTPYPLLSRHLGEEGEVLVRVWVDSTGVAKNGTILRSSGFNRLDEAGLATALSRLYSYVSCYGQPPSGWLQVPVRFQLGG